MRRLADDDAARLEAALGPGGFEQETARPCLTRSEARLLIEPAQAVADQPFLKTA
ncbi:hypothetical protein [Roseobacter sinensis]|uniref:Uncharacterized protein n=1 Tax=Roseobacter sinensis TaxID=2931391 RepID=A0ABT3BEL9_9RHOB|nr:hypothetical protein [Roseobacter sp. WL0113]MCV3271643.1 hypothetical protein [Roseobacter sp. WL0113]